MRTKRLMQGVVLVIGGTLAANEAALAVDLPAARRRSRFRRTVTHHRPSAHQCRRLTTTAGRSLTTTRRRLTTVTMMNDDYPRAAARSISACTEA